MRTGSAAALHAASTKSRVKDNSVGAHGDLSHWEWVSSLVKQDGESLAPLALSPLIPLTVVTDYILCGQKEIS
jgi:hypothetical protein